jgi:hypothetical protein
MDVPEPHQLFQDAGRQGASAHTHAQGASHKRATPAPRGRDACNHVRVQYEDSDMSFSVSADGGRLEWAGASLSTVFAQWSNLFSPSFLRMLYDMQRCVCACTAASGRTLAHRPRRVLVPRFNAAGPEYLTRTDTRSLTLTLGEYLAEHGYSDAFRDNYLLPMTASIWSTPASEMLKFPMLTMFRFCHNHGLLQVNGRPQWLTVSQGRHARLLLASPAPAHAASLLTVYVVGWVGACVCVGDRQPRVPAAGAGQGTRGAAQHAGGGCAAHAGWASRRARPSAAGGDL